MKAFLLLTVLLTGFAMAEDAKTSKKTDDKTAEQKPANVQQVLTKSKKPRTKKVEMCHECGKPESECDCEGHENEKKAEKK